MNNKPIRWLDDAGEVGFPPAHAALEQPNGLLAVGGRLTPQRLEDAYRRGIFPWFEDGQPVLWWCPDPRTLLYPIQLHVSRSLRRRLRKQDYRVTMDMAFDSVIRACAAPRSGQRGTWITPAMQEAYRLLRRRGLAHSVEVWQDGRLTGGLYGVSIGRGFFGESMFSARPDASKVALVWLTRQLQVWGFPFLDCQVGSSHLYALGAIDVPRPRFLGELETALARSDPAGPDWAFDPDFHPLELAA